MAKAPVKKRKRKARKPPPHQGGAVLDSTKVPTVPPDPEIAIAKACRKTVGAPGKSSLEPPPQSETNQYIRFAAGLYYTTHIRGTTIEQMSKHPLYGRVSYSTLESWSKKDRWGERRQENMRRWREALESTIGSELLKARVKNLAKLRNIFDKVVEKLEAENPVEAKSYEGLVKALVSLADLIDGHQTKVGQELVPGVMAVATAEASESGDPRITASLSSDEARMATKAILEDRRRKLRQKQMMESAAEEPQKPAKLEVINGQKALPPPQREQKE